MKRLPQALCLGCRRQPHGCNSTAKNEHGAFPGRRRAGLFPRNRDAAQGQLAQHDIDTQAELSCDAAKTALMRRINTAACDFP
jgi:hypothetical protein